MLRVDLSNQQLWHGDQPVRLRPKTFAVLRYLVENPGRLVTRDELIKAVWPDTNGAEKGPKRCILELRAALGDRAEAPRLIETVGRLGYRLIAPFVTTAESLGIPCAEALKTSLTTPNPQPPTPGIVGREPELAELRRLLREAMGGERRVAFVTGEPGIGKTSLVQAFLHQVATREPAAVPGHTVWIARGQCIEHYGDGEAYLPILEALRRLAETPGDSRWLDFLRRDAPSWLAQLPGLMTDAELESLQPRLQGATPQRMLREIADAIRGFTAQTPLILLLEDLHWSDYSTLDFVSAVVQRQDLARFFLIITYRSTDLAGDHPLRPVAQELLSHGRARELPLAGFTREAVEQYLDFRFPRQKFPRALAGLLHRHTGGNPLFLVNLLDDLVAQNLLSPVEGSWALHVSPQALAKRVPANSRRLIEKQMDRLAPATRAYLEAAGIAGVEFAAEVVASALQVDTERLEEHCDELARQGLFLERVGVEDWPDGTRTTRYRFRHALYQRLWAERVSAQRRQRLHTCIGERLERSYGEGAAEIAAELAMHFGEGRDHARAAQYHYCAAQNALRRSAHREATDHLHKGIASLAVLPETPERAAQELALQIVLGVPLTAVKGYAAPEVERAYRRAVVLSEQVEDNSQVVQALLGLWVFYFVRAELRTALHLASRCLEKTQLVRACDLALDTHNAVGDTLLWLGELSSAREHLEQALALHDRRQHPAYVSYDVTDPGVGCLSHLSWTLWQLGYPDQALQRSREAVALAEGLSHAYSLAYASSFAAALHWFRREDLRARERAEASVRLATEQEFPLWLAMGTIFRSWSLIAQGDADVGLSDIRRGLATYRAIGAELGCSAFLALLAESYGATGQARTGLRVLAEALAVVEKNDERLYEAEIHRLQGELLLRLGSQAGGRGNGRRAEGAQAPKDATLLAEECFLRAIAVAEEQHARSLQLRAATSLSRLWCRQKKSDEAYELLSKVYGWFTEGFDTADLMEAKNLLTELSLRR